MTIYSGPADAPEVMGHMFENFYNPEAVWRVAPDWLIEPLVIIYKELLGTMDRERRFQLYKKANEYIADQALALTIMAPLSLYGVNEEVEFVSQLSQYLYLDYSSVTDNHWSIEKRTTK